MNQEAKETYRGYYSRTSELGPWPNLKKAVGYIQQNNPTALDLGCGAGRDTRFLTEKGFTVDAVDRNEDISSYISKYNRENRLSIHICSMNEYKYPALYYDLVNAQFSLPFNTRESLAGIWQSILDSLKQGGIFTGTFFGVNDGWNAGDGHPKMTFYRKMRSMHSWMVWRYYT
jgi:SAM-dependent methyltransferase